MSAVLTSYAVGLGTVALVVAIWVTIQNGWRRTFPEVASDPDVLAARRKCSSCKGPKEEHSCP